MVFELKHLPLRNRSLDLGRKSFVARVRRIKWRVRPLRNPKKSTFNVFAARGGYVTFPEIFIHGQIFQISGFFQVFEQKLMHHYQCRENCWHTFPARHREHSNYGMSQNWSFSMLRISSKIDDFRNFLKF